MHYYLSNFMARFQWNLLFSTQLTIFFRFSSCITVRLLYDDVVSGYPCWSFTRKEFFNIRHSTPNVSSWRQQGRIVWTEVFNRKACVSTPGLLFKRQRRTIGEVHSEIFVENVDMNRGLNHSRFSRKNPGTRATPGRGGGLSYC